MNRGIPISKFYRSFSGTDSIAFLIFPGIIPIVIGSLTTISYSMYRNKVPVINIGRTNVNGITRGSRIYGGTMVFTLINKHWLRELQDQASYLQNYPTLKTDELPLFDIMIVSANEYGSSCSMFIYGVDFTDESQTLSVEDLFTENVFKFIAREISVFDENIIQSDGDINKKTSYTINSASIKNYYSGMNTVQSDILKNEDTIQSLNRTLYLITNGNPLMGEDVARVQQLLNLANPDNPIAITYRFDRMTDSAVRDFQSKNGLIVNGIVDNSVYTKLLTNKKTNDSGEYVQIINKSGAFVYKEPNTSSMIVQTLPYLSSVEVFGQEEDNNEKFYQTKEGYISLYDSYNYLNNTSSYTYEPLKYGDTDPQVTILQNILSSLYENYESENGYYGPNTEKYVKYFQKLNGLNPTGIADYYTWNVLLNNSDDNNKKYISNHSDLSFSKEPGEYNIKDLNYLKDFVISINNNNIQQVKYSVISLYKDGSIKTDSQILTFNGTKETDINVFKNMFKDDVNKLTPTDVYYFVYPYGDIPYKWHFNIKR